MEKRDLSRCCSFRRTRYECGFSLMELCVVLGIVFIMAAMAIPMVQSTIAFYDLQGAVASVSGTIQSTRYQSISDGVPYRATFRQADNTYQLSQCPDWTPTNPVCTPKNVSSLIPFGGDAVQLSADTTIQFSPSGNLTFLKGASPFTLSRRVGSSVKAKTITVTNYGIVKVQ